MAAAARWQGGVALSGVLEIKPAKHAVRAASGDAVNIQKVTKNTYGFFLPKK